MSARETDNDVMDATPEQIALLKQLGASDKELEGITYEDAEIMIDAIRTMRQNAMKRNS